MRLTHVYNPTQTYPSFVIPIFKDGDAYYCQNGPDTCVTGFLECNVGDSFLEPFDRDVEVSIGDPFFYAFAVQKSCLFAGDKAQLELSLKHQIEYIRKSIFIYIEFCSFFGLEQERIEACKEAAKLLIFDNDATISNQWLESMIGK